MSWRQLALQNKRFKEGERVEVKWGKEWLEAVVMGERRGGAYEIRFTLDDFTKIALRNEMRKGIFIMFC